MNNIFLCAGEYGEMLVGGGQQLLPDEPGVSASSTEVVDVLEGVLNRPGCPQQCRDFALTALMKLSVRFADQAERIKVSSIFAVETPQAGGRSSHSDQR